MEQPLVSVVILTYNHEDYIGQALDGVLAQKVNFPIEIIVSNDCSTDNTDAVCQQYAQAHSCIRYYNHKQNLGLTKNHCWTVKQANGKYIAYCDGDDYWTDPYKLQHQMDYMESHSECSMCYHNVILDDSNARWLFLSPNKRSGLISLEEVVKVWAIPTSSVVYRRECIAGEEDRVIRYANEDYAVEIFMLTKGECYFDESIYGVINRRHPTSVSAGMNRKPIKMYEDLIAFLEDAKLWFPEDKHHCFDEAIARYESSKRCVIKNLKYPFLKYICPRTYKRWLAEVLNR